MVLKLLFIIYFIIIYYLYKLFQFNFDHWYPFISLFLHSNKHLTRFKDANLSYPFLSIQHVPGVIAVTFFYVMVLGIGNFAARKSKKAEEETGGDRQEALLLGKRKIDWIVGIFTMAGKPR